MSLTRKDPVHALESVTVAKLTAAQVRAAHLSRVGTWTEGESTDGTWRCRGSCKPQNDT